MTRKRSICIGLAIAMLGAIHTSSSVASGVSYAYDALGRLTQITYDNGTTIVFTYDATGNRTSRVITCSGSPC